MDPGSPLRCVRDDRPGSAALGFVVVVICLVLQTSAALAEIRSGSDFLSPELRRQQADETRNPGFFWVEQGRELFTRRPAGDGQACIGCHVEPQQSLRGAATRYPQVDAATGRLMNLEGRIEQCRAERQGQPVFGYESPELLSLTAYLASLSRGLPMQVTTDGPAKPFYEAGKAFFERRQGQLNLSCQQCHDGLVGQKLRGDTISHGAGTGYRPTAWNGTMSARCTGACGPARSACARRSSRRAGRNISRWSSSSPPAPEAFPSRRQPCGADRSSPGPVIALSWTGRHKR